MADKWRLDKNTHKWVLDLSDDKSAGYKPKTIEEIRAMAAKPSPSPSPKAEESPAQLAERLKRERDARAAKYVSKKKKEQE